MGYSFIDYWTNNFYHTYFLPVKDDIETLRKRAEKERTKHGAKVKLTMLMKKSERTN